MGANLTRFIAWQHPLLLTLAIFGVWANRRSESLVQALAVSFALPVLVCLIVMPWQGLGWGYRYLHPALGSAVLLAGWGWRALEQQGRTLWQPLIWTSAASMLLLVPIHGWMAHRMARSFAAAKEQITSFPGDVLILDAQIVAELTYNKPDLSNRPIRLLAAELHSGDMTQVCRNRTVVFVDPPLPRQPSDHQEALKAAASRAGCAAKVVHISVGDELLTRLP